jgi:hypothetical protein
MERSTLTIRLPQEDLEFAKRYAEEHQMTLAELIDGQLKKLRLGTEDDGRSGRDSAESEAVALGENLQQDPDYAAFLSEKGRLLCELAGHYVAYCRGKRVAQAASLDEVFSVLDAEFRDDPCFVQQVSPELRRVTFRRPLGVRSAPA